MPASAETLGHRYSTARVKRQSQWSAACLRARYCTGQRCSGLAWKMCPRH